MDTPLTLFRLSLKDIQCSQKEKGQENHDTNSSVPAVYIP